MIEALTSSSSSSLNYNNSNSVPISPPSDWDRDSTRHLLSVLPSPDLNTLNRLYREAESIKGENEDTPLSSSNNDNNHQEEEEEEEEKRQTPSSPKHQQRRTLLLPNLKVMEVNVFNSSGFTLPLPLSTKKETTGEEDITTTTTAASNSGDVVEEEEEEKKQSSQSPPEMQTATTITSGTTTTTTTTTITATGATTTKDVVLPDNGVELPETLLVDLNSLNRLYHEASKEYKRHRKQKRLEKQRSRSNSMEEEETKYCEDGGGDSAPAIDDSEDDKTVHHSNETATKEKSYNDNNNNHDSASSSLGEICENSSGKNANPTQEESPGEDTAPISSNDVVQEVRDEKIVEIGTPMTKSTTIPTTSTPSTTSNPPIIINNTKDIEKEEDAAATSATTDTDPALQRYGMNLNTLNRLYKGATNEFKRDRKKGNKKKKGSTSNQANMVETVAGEITMEQQQTLSGSVSSFVSSSSSSRPDDITPSKDAATNVLSPASSSSSDPSTPVRRLDVEIERITRMKELSSSTSPTILATTTSTTIIEDTEQKYGRDLNSMNRLYRDAAREYKRRFRKAMQKKKKVEATSITTAETANRNCSSEERKEDESNQREGQDTEEKAVIQEEDKNCRTEETATTPGGGDDDLGWSPKNSEEIVSPSPATDGELKAEEDDVKVLDAASGGDYSGVDKVDEVNELRGQPQEEVTAVAAAASHDGNETTIDEPPTVGADGRGGTVDADGNDEFAEATSAQLGTNSEESDVMPPLEESGDGKDEKETTRTEEEGEAESKDAGNSNMAQESLSSQVSPGAPSQLAIVTGDGSDTGKKVDNTSHQETDKQPPTTPVIFSLLQSWSTGLQAEEKEAQQQDPKPLTNLPTDEPNPLSHWYKKIAATSFRSLTGVNNGEETNQEDEDGNGQGKILEHNNAAVTSTSATSLQNDNSVAGAVTTATDTLPPLQDTPNTPNSLSVTSSTDDNNSQSSLDLNSLNRLYRETSKELKKALKKQQKKKKRTKTEEEKKAILMTRLKSETTREIRQTRNRRESFASIQDHLLLDLPDVDDDEAPHYFAGTIGGGGGSGFRLLPRLSERQDSQPEAIDLVL